MFAVSKYMLGHQLDLIGQDDIPSSCFLYHPCLVLFLLSLSYITLALCSPPNSKRLHSKRLHNRYSSFVAELGMFLSFNAVISDDSSHKLYHQTLDIVI